MSEKTHNQQIVSQFTKQAAAYTAIASHSEALEKLVAISGVSDRDHVLDVACGSGIVSLAFAEHAKQVTGIDITPEMLKQAEKQQRIRNMHNVEWLLAKADHLPFADNSFSVVVSRFSFHHFLNPGKVFDEMFRVCKIGGTVVLVDVAVAKAHAEQYDFMEKIRDPSHASVKSAEELESFFLKAGMRNIRSDKYEMRIELEEQLKASFSEDGKLLRQMIIGNADTDKLGIRVKKEGGIFYLFYPIHILAANK